MNGFGEDVSISSLHLFQGYMDLPALSFHASLEEQGDVEEDPEEVETVLKVGVTTMEINPLGPPYG
ncbi:hypothetical protein O181_113796, partial [Austropuccinia psidii MF-1]|nr:hypothetical protein [Austropuccinia psidii MF-1]